MTIDEREREREDMKGEPGEDLGEVEIEVHTVESFVKRRENEAKVVGWAVLCCVKTKAEGVRVGGQRRRLLPQ